jgi:Leucine Rich repeat
LVLDQCGRCFTNATVQALVSTVTNSQSKARSPLLALSIGGAYGLSDDQAATLVDSLAPATLEFKACNLLGAITCRSIAQTFGQASPSFSTLVPAPPRLVELALEDIPCSTNDLQLLTTHTDAWRHIKSLSLRRLDGLTDALAVELVQLTATTLEGLDLTENPQLTDAILEGLRLYDTRRLHSLVLSGLVLLTAVGLEALFTVVEGAPLPPMLRTLDLGKCAKDAVTDDVIRLATAAATQNRDSTESAASPQKQALLGGLVHLNVQGAALITDIAMESIVNTSSRTLQVLNVSFCTTLTDQGLGYLVDQCGRQLRQIHVWGNAQLSDDFFDGHLRCQDPTLEIVGVWMKNNTSRTIR